MENDKNVTLRPNPEEFNEGVTYSEMGLRLFDFIILVSDSVIIIGHDIVIPEMRSVNKLIMTYWVIHCLGFMSCNTKIKIYGNVSHIKPDLNVMLKSFIFDMLNIYRASVPGFIKMIYIITNYF